MRDTLTIKTPLLNPDSERPLTPAMLTALWVISDELDQRRTPANSQDALWLRIPSASLRGEGSRADNHWLRQCLDRLLGVKLSGEYRGDPWGAVCLAEYHIEEGGAVVRLLLPPAAVRAMRSPETFAKIETHAAFKMDPNARRLYALLADRKNMRDKEIIFTVEQLRKELRLDQRKSYERWDNFRNVVLLPSLQKINDFGTVSVSMHPIREGRSIAAVRFCWEWKTIDEARETDEENEKPAIQRRKVQAANDAPPLTDEAAEKNARASLERWVITFRQDRGRDPTPEEIAARAAAMVARAAKG